VNVARWCEPRRGLLICEAALKVGVSPGGSALGFQIGNGMVCVIA
jgi:hypothetical protein